MCIVLLDQARVVQKVDTAIHQAPVVQRLDNAIHQISPHPVDKCQQNKPCYPLDSDLFGG